MSSAPPWLPLLRKIFFFSALTENHLSLVARKITQVAFPKGAILFKEHQPGDSVYLILSGSILITKSPGPQYRDEPDKVLAYLNRGDALGEMSFLTGERHLSSAIADTTAEVLVLRKSDFDALIEKHPTLAVHLSRILTRRIADVNHALNTNPSQGKVFTFIPAIPVRDQVVFGINFGISLLEQTRKKVFMVIVHESPQVFANSLGLELPIITAPQLRNGFFEKHEKLAQGLLIHPSGLELLLLDKKSFFGHLNSRLFTFLDLVREYYDITVLILPPEHTDLSTSLMKESNRSAIITGPQSHPHDVEQARKLQQDASERKRVEDIWLAEGHDVLPWDYAPDIKLPWKSDWGRQFTESGSPFIPMEDRLGHRSLSRLARNFGGYVIGLAMGSGAAFGYAVIGMLRVLERENIYPDVVSGTSMGALIGAFYASGKGPDELEEIAKTITRKKLISMVDFGLPFRSGLIKGKGVLQFLRSHLGDKTFQDLQIPYACVATDIQTGKEIILDQGNVAEAVRASISLPFFFQPYNIRGRYLVDGGLVNPVPTSIIVNLGANILLSANLTSKTGDRKIPHVLGWRRRLPPILRGPSIIEILMKTIYTMQYEISSARSSLAHVVMQVNANDMLWWDLDKASEMIRLGEAVAEESLPKIKSLLPFFSDSCRVHLSTKGRKTY